MPIRRSLRPAAFDVLALRDYRYFWLAGAAGDFALGIWFFATAWAVLELTNSKAWVGVVGGAAGAPPLVLGLFGGVISDRFSKVRLVQAGSVLFGAVLVTSAVAVQVAPITPWHFLTFALLIGVIGSFHGGSSKALVAELVDRTQLVSANALNELAEFAGEIAAPLLVGGIIAASGTAPAYWVAVSAGIVAVLLIGRLRAPGTSQGGAWSVVRDVVDGISYLRHEAPYTALLAIAATALFGSMITPLIPVYARDVLDVGAVGFGVLAAALGAGLAAGSIYLTVAGDIRRKALLILVTFAAADAAIVGFAFSRSYPVSVVLIFLVGLGSAIGGNMVVTLFQMRADEAFRGRVMSVYYITASLVPLGAILGGFTAAAFGNETALVVSGLAAFVPVVLAYAASPTLRTM